MGELIFSQRSRIQVPAFWPLCNLTLFALTRASSRLRAPTYKLPQLCVNTFSGVELVLGKG